MLGQFGIANIADKAPERGQAATRSCPPSRSVRPTPISCSSPTARCCGQTPQTVAKRPGWAQLTAVRNGNVVGIDDDIASRWGPRLADLVQAVGTAVDKAAKQGGA